MLQLWLALLLLVKTINPIHGFTQQYPYLSPNVTVFSWRPSMYQCSDMNSWIISYNTIYLACDRPIISRVAPAGVYRINDVNDMYDPILNSDEFTKNDFTKRLTNIECALGARYLQLSPSTEYMYVQCNRSQYVTIAHPKSTTPIITTFTNVTDNCRMLSITTDANGDTGYFTCPDEGGLLSVRMNDTTVTKLVTADMCYSPTSLVVHLDKLYLVCDTLVEVNMISGVVTNFTLPTTCFAPIQLQISSDSLYMLCDSSVIRMSLQTVHNMITLFTTSNECTELGSIAVNGSTVYVTCSYTSSRRLVPTLLRISSLGNHTVLDSHNCIWPEKLYVAGDILYVGCGTPLASSILTVSGAGTGDTSTDSSSTSSLSSSSSSSTGASYSLPPDSSSTVLLSSSSSSSSSSNPLTQPNGADIAFCYPVIVLLCLMTHIFFLNPV